MTDDRPAFPGAFCALCGSTDVAGLGEVIGICLDARACHERQRQVWARSREALEDLLASIWLYVPWRFITMQLTTAQKDMWADALEMSSARAGERTTADRWWRDAS